MKKPSPNSAPQVPISSVALPTAINKGATRLMRVGPGVIAFDDTGGSGPLIIAVPGMGDLRTEYRYLTPYLTSAGYRVVTVDVRGHGESSTEWDDYSAHAVGRDVLALITHLGQQKAAIIGNSFSAGSALWAAHDAPERVIAVVLLGPILRDPPQGTPWYMRALLALGFNGPWRVAFWLRYYASLFPSRKPDDFPAYCQALRQNLREWGRMDALKAMIDLSKADTEAMLSKTGLHSLIIMGTKDADFTDAIAEGMWAADRIGAELLTVEGAGHYPQTEMAEEVGPAIVRFLQADKQ